MEVRALGNRILETGFGGKDLKVQKFGGRDLGCRN